MYSLRSYSCLPSGWHTRTKQGTQGGIPWLQVMGLAYSGGGKKHYWQLVATLYIYNTNPIHLVKGYSYNKW